VKVMQRFKPAKQPHVQCSKVNRELPDVATAQTTEKQSSIMTSEVLRTIKARGMQHLFRALSKKG